MKGTMPPVDPTFGLRVLLVSHGLPPENVGGVEQHVDGLARALQGLGHSVHVLAKSGRAGSSQFTVVDEPPSRAMPYPVSRMVYRYEGVDGLRRLYEVPEADAAFDAFLRQHDFDVVHLHHLTGLSTGFPKVLARHGLPTVMTLHDYWTICPRGQMWHRDGSVCQTAEAGRCAGCQRDTFRGWIPDGDAGTELVAGFLEHARELLSIPQLLIVTSPRVRAPFEAMGVDAQRMPRVENGVDTVALRTVPEVSPRRDAPLRLGYLGTLIPSKGLDVLVRAVCELPPGAVELHVHGNVVSYHGDDGFLTRAFAPVQPVHSVTWHGPYHTDDLPEILATVDVVAQPALWEETYGLTVREALAAGRPVLVSRIGGLQEAFTDGVGGRILPPGDVSAWRDTLAELAADPQKVAEMGRQARAEAPVRGFAEMAADVVDVYRSAIGLATS